MTSPRYRPMHGPEKQPESKRSGTCPPWSVCVPTTVASLQSISRVAMCPSISCRPVCPPDRWSISVPGRHPADRQSPGAEGSAIDIGYMASGLISMPSRACASSDIGAIPRAYVPADIAGCRHTLRYRIRIMEHEYDEQHRVALKGDDDICFMAAQGRSVCSSHCAANIVDVAVYRDVAVW